MGLYSPCYALQVLRIQVKANDLMNCAYLRF